MNAYTELLPYNPIADPKAVVVSGKARFTVLTDALIRLEYSDSSSFGDRQTLAFVNRALTVPKFSKSVDSTFVNITTAKLALSYRVGGGFDSSSLTIRSLDPANP